MEYNYPDCTHQVYVIEITKNRSNKDKHTGSQTIKQLTKCPHSFRFKRINDDVLDLKSKWNGLDNLQGWADAKTTNYRFKY